MHSVAGHQWMMIFFATVILGTVCYQEVSAGHGPVRVTRSAVESLRDHGTYIIHFKDYITEKELQHFAAVLSRRSAKGDKFRAEIIEEIFVIKCLTAKLSGRALNWVSTVYVSSVKDYILLYASLIFMQNIIFICRLHITRQF